MKNLFKLLTLTAMLFTIPAQKSHATVGLLSLNTQTALTGLFLTPVGALAVTITASPVSLFVLGMGLLLLDEESGSIEFTKVSTETAKRKGITENEMEIYNSELEEVNAVFTEVTQSLDSDSTIEESRALWQDMKEYVSPETFKVMQSVNR